LASDKWQAHHNNDSALAQSDFSVSEDTSHSQIDEILSDFFVPAACFASAFSLLGIAGTANKLLRDANAILHRESDRLVMQFLNDNIAAFGDDQQEWITNNKNNFYFNLSQLKKISCLLEFIKQVDLEAGISISEAYLPAIENILLAETQNKKAGCGGNCGKFWSFFSSKDASSVPAET
tara:strand:- start:48 stop:584 length:537 start_codon:yes stop_codon:yes gene_type:complete